MSVCPCASVRVYFCIVLCITGREVSFREYTEHYSRSIVIQFLFKIGEELAPECGYDA